MALNKIASLFFIAGFLFAASSVLAADDVGCCQKFNPPDPQGHSKMTTEDSTREHCEQIASQYDHTNFVADKRAIGNECKDKLITAPQTAGSPVEFKPEITLPGSQYVAGSSIKLSEDTRALAEYIIAIFKYSIGIIGIISAIVLMFAGIRWLTSAGNSGAVEEAKTAIAGSLGGLVLTLGAFLLLSTVNENLVKLTVPSVKKAQYVGLGDGCCLKTDKQTKAITAVDASKEQCESIEYATTQYFPDSSAQNNQCVLDKGCCFVKIPHGISVGFWTTGNTEKICLEHYKRASCEATDKGGIVTTALKSVGTIGAATSLGVVSNLVNSVRGTTTTEFKDGACTQWDMCTEAQIRNP